MLKYKNKLHQFLKKNRKILKDTGFLFMGRFTQKLLSLITILFLIRYLSQESFGEYSFVMGVAGLCSIFSLGGMGNSLIQSVSRGFEGTYRKSMKYTLIGSLASSFILFVFTAYYYYLGEMEMSVAFFAITTLIPFTYGLSYWKSVYSGQQKFKELSILMFCMDVLKNISIISLLYFQSPTIIVPAFIMFFVPAVFNIFLTLKLLSIIPSESPIEQESLKYGLQTTFFSSFNVVANKVDAMLIFFVLSPVSLAIYTVAERISEIVKEGVNDIGLILAPRFAKQDNYTSRVNKALKLLSFLIAVGILFFAFIILPLCMEPLFEKKYLPSLSYTQILLASVAIAVYHNFKFRYVMSKLDSDSFRDFNIYTSLARILFSIALIPILGIWGAVISTVLYRLFSILFVEYIMRKKYKTV